MDGGSYEDYCMIPPESEDAVAGVCHKRGPNQDLPSQWLMYINVPDLEKSMQNCQSLGGKIVHGPRDMGPHGKMCVIQDPAGAFLALMEPA